ncbi:MAG: QueT transporter family protein [Firmicutes bacterium]|nr:QueT transporter family protein [Bacillota bacterium]
MDLNFKSNSKYLAEVAIIASIYVILTISLGALSFGINVPFLPIPIQLRISEALLVLVLFRKSAPAGLVLGCFIANFWSPFMMPDMIFGTLGSALAVYGIYRLKNINIFITLTPGVFFNALLVALELKIFFKIPFFWSGVAVAIGQTLVIYVLGIPLYYALKRIGFKNDYENV